MLFDKTLSIHELRKFDTSDVGEDLTHYERPPHGVAKMLPDMPLVSVPTGQVMSSAEVREFLETISQATTHLSKGNRANHTEPVMLAIQMFKLQVILRSTSGQRDAAALASMDFLREVTKIPSANAKVIAAALNLLADVLFSSSDEMVHSIKEPLYAVLRQVGSYNVQVDDVLYRCYLTVFKLLYVKSTMTPLSDLKRLVRECSSTSYNPTFGMAAASLLTVI